MSNNISRALDDLKEVDIYSVILFVIFKLKDDPQYSTLSELVYLLDNKSFLNILEYYGGKTIKIPTMSEFKEIIDALCIYDLVNVEGQEYNKVLKELDITGDNLKNITSKYLKVAEVLKDYDFRRS